MPNQLNQGEFRLVEAIVDKLRSFPELVSLTKHMTDGRSHISASMPQTTKILPFLSVSVIDTYPQSVAAPHTGWRRSRVELCGFSTDELAAIHIIDYVEGLVLGTSSDSDINRRFLDFSNGHLRNPMTTYLVRHGTSFGDLEDVWESSINIELIWIDKPCEENCSHCLPQTDCDDDIDCSSNC